MAFMKGLYTRLKDTKNAPEDVVFQNIGVIERGCPRGFLPYKTLDTFYGVPVQIAPTGIHRPFPENLNSWIAN